MRIKTEDIIAALRLIADDLESGVMESGFAMVEEHYNLPCIEGEFKFSVIYKRA